MAIIKRLSSSSLLSSSSSSWILGQVWNCCISTRSLQATKIFPGAEALVVPILVKIQWWVWMDLITNWREAGVELICVSPPLLPRQVWAMLILWLQRQTKWRPSISEVNQGKSCYVTLMFAFTKEEHSLLPSIPLWMQCRTFMTVLQDSSYQDKTWCCMFLPCRCGSWGKEEKVELVWEHRWLNIQNFRIQE